MLQRATCGRVVTLVFEGGAARAAYGSGVADAFQASGLAPDAIYGTSAGAAIAAWYAAGQAAQGIKTWDSIVDRSLLSYRRMLVGKPVLNFGRLYGELYPSHFGMDLARLRASPYPAYATMTDADTAETVYVDLRSAKDPMRVLHATSALPLVSDSPVEIDGHRYVDGGMTDPIPIRRAIEDGHRDILLVASRVAAPRAAEPDIITRLVARKFPKLREATANHHRFQNDAIALALSPPPGVRVRILRPTRDLGVSRLTRSLPRLHAAVAEGRKDGARLMLELGLPAPQVA
jgi:predicted patatin/cPLA2 family phospholipase